MPMTITEVSLSGHVLDSWLTGAPVVGGWKYPSVGYRSSVYFTGAADLKAAIYIKEGLSVPKGVVLYMHGSGQDELPPLNHYLFNAITDIDYAVICVIQWGRGTTSNGEHLSKQPYRYTYGNSWSPDFIGESIRKNQWVAASMVLATNYSRSFPSSPNLPIVMLGQSYGATAALVFNGYGHYVPVGTVDTLAANREIMSVLNNPNFKGVIINGMTQAAWGAGSAEGPAWNDVNRIINHYTPMIALARYPMLMLYGDKDYLAPPDLVKYFQSAIPEGSRTAVIGAGVDSIHGWMNTPTGAPAAAEWCRQMITDSPITTLAGQTTGELAVFGPAV